MTGRWRSRVIRLWSVLTRREAGAELEDEFEHHLGLAAAEFHRQGHSTAEARRLAAVRFGSRVAAPRGCARGAWVPGPGTHLALRRSTPCPRWEAA